MCPILIRTLLISIFTVICLQAFATISVYDPASDKANYDPSKRHCYPAFTCYPPDTMYFDGSDLTEILQDIGLTGDEEFTDCRMERNRYRCRQKPVKGVELAYDFQIGVELWSLEDRDVRWVRCMCVRADIEIPDGITDQEAAGIAESYMRGHLFVVEDSSVAMTQPPERYILPDRRAYSEALYNQFHLVKSVPLAFFAYPSGKHADVKVDVDVESGWVYLYRNRYQQLRKPQGRLPPDELQEKWLMNPEDNNLRDEYLSYLAFRRQGQEEMAFQGNHRKALAEWYPEGAGTYYIVFRELLTAERALALLSKYPSYIESIHYLYNHYGDRLSRGDFEEFDTGRNDRLVALKHQLQNGCGPIGACLFPPPEPRFDDLDRHRFTSAYVQMYPGDALALWNDRGEDILAINPIIEKGRLNQDHRSELQLRREQVELVE